MVVTQSKILTLEEFLNYEDGTDTRYELFDGELVEMPTESDVNVRIAKFLFFELAKFFPIDLIAHKDVEIELPGKRAKCRLPDLMIHSQGSFQAVTGADRSIIRLDMPPPDLIIEVVSPGKENSDRDYRYKRTEYAGRGVTEYWIIDPQLKQITVCQLIRGQYEDIIFRDKTPIDSIVISHFVLSAQEILSFGQVNKN